MLPSGPTNTIHSLAQYSNIPIILYNAMHQRSAAVDRWNLFGHPSASVPMHFAKGRRGISDKSAVIQQCMPCSFLAGITCLSCTLDPRPPTPLLPPRSLLIFLFKREAEKIQQLWESARCSAFFAKLEAPTREAVSAWNASFPWECGKIVLLFTWNVQ